LPRRAGSRTPFEREPRRPPLAPRLGAALAFYAVISLAPLLIVLVYQTIMAIAIFDLVYVLTGGGPGSATTLFSWFVYITTFRFLNLGQGAALSLLMALLFLVIIVVYLWRIRPEEEGV
jgi:ABC-type sugar transport system permease subunit